MVDISSRLFWYRSKEWYQIMADKLSDFVYTDESKETMDVINVFLLGWILLGLIVYIIGNFIATYLKKRKLSLPVQKPETADEISKPTDHVPYDYDIKTITQDSLPESEKTPTFFKVPSCEGDDEEIVKWINDVLLWIYKQRVVSPIIDSWLSALNGRTRLFSTEHGILVDFKDLLHTSGPPKVTELRQSSSSKFDNNVTSEIELSDMTFEVVVTQFKENEKITSPFLLHVQRLFGKVFIECSPEDLLFVAKYSEVPQIQLSATAAGTNEAVEEDNQPLCDLVCEITSDALSSANVPLRFSCFPNCPRLLTKCHSEEDVFEAAESENDRHLLVKIIKATQLGGRKGCSKPYCIVEMDEPPQKFETPAAEGTNNPFWDAAYTFTVKDSAELLFEIYDKDKPSTENFLGLGIVGVDELMRNPSQRQIIPLQSRPLEDDDITGSLTAEFLFLNQITPVSDAIHLAQYKAKKETVSSPEKIVETNSRVTAGGTVITTTTIKRTKEEDNDRLEPKANTNTISLAEPNLMQRAEETLDPDKVDISEKANTLSKQPTINGDCKMLKSLEDDSKKLSFPNESSNPEDSDSLTMKVNNIMEAEPTLEKEALGNIPACMHVPPSIPTLIVQEILENGSIKNELHVLNPENNAYTMQDSQGGALPSVVAGIKPQQREGVNTSVLPSNGLVIQKDAEADLTGTALKELEKHSTPTSTSKSTLIIHSVQRAENSASQDLEASPASNIAGESHTSYSESVPSSPTQDRGAGYRSRPQEKKSFMGGLRRRLSFHKNRSKSAENRFELESNYSHASSRSASTDRSRQPTSQKLSPFKGRFLGRQFLTVTGSTRSSLSEASGISASTYVNENSTLVIETNENGIIKRYLIPNSLVHRSKWKKRGTKLHIFNDHVFLAKHLSGSTVCQVCQRHLTRRPGKQGYECRGCNLQCHKSCHVKVDNYCSNSSINAMEVEYIHDPKGASPKSI